MPTEVKYHSHFAYEETETVKKLRDYIKPRSQSL